MTLTDKYWLAGLLEGEGWFGAGPPSVPNRTLVELKMTDEDIVSKASSIMGSSYYEQPRNDGRKTVWITRVTGEKARRLMIELRPLMGRRRQCAIDKALESYDPTAFIRSYFARSKVDEQLARKIYLFIEQGNSQANAAKKFRRSRASIKTAHRRYQKLLDIQGHES